MNRATIARAMPQRKSDERIGLDLTADERTLLLDDALFLDESFVQSIRQAPPGVSIQFTVDELEQLADELAAESKHAEDGQLDGIYDKIQLVLSLPSDGEGSRHS